MRILGYIWSLPNTLIGLLLAVAYWPTGFRIVDGNIELRASRAMIGRPAGQTWGCVIWYDRLTWGMESLGRRAIRHHEQVHVRQGMIGGVFFMLAYAAQFLYLWGRNGFDWYTAYRAIYWERVAHIAQWVYITENLRITTSEQTRNEAGAEYITAENISPDRHNFSWQSEGADRER